MVIHLSVFMKLYCAVVFPFISGMIKKSPFDILEWDKFSIIVHSSEVDKIPDF